MNISRLLIVLTSALCAAPFAVAQEQGAATTDSPAVTLPTKPVVIPMTPGAGTKSATTPKPRTRVITAPGSTQTATAAPVPRSDGDYQFCNRTSYQLNIAVGVKQQGSFWATRGWWPLPAGECKPVIKGKLTQQTYYTFARSAFAHTGPIREWGGSQILCTGKAQFEATSDGSDQCGPGLEPQGFARVDTNGKPSWTTILSESPAFKTQEQARIAGLQRLLADLGRYQGEIDGTAGPKFSEALAQARNAYSIPSSDDVATVYAKLYAETNRQQIAWGLTLCNRTQDVVWAALAQDTQGKKLSQGWWRLQPGQCEKVIKDRLTERFIYAFGEPVGNAKEPWSGAHTFCTRPALFSIEGADDCEGRGFKRTGFLQIDTGSRPGLTFEFAPRREEAPAPNP